MTRRRLEDAVNRGRKGPRGGGDGGRRSVRRAALYAKKMPGETRLLGPGSNPECATDLLKTRDFTVSRRGRGVCSPTLQRNLENYGRQTTVRAQTHGCRAAPQDLSPPLASRLAGPGFYRSPRRPRPAPGMRNSARTQRGVAAAR